MNSKSDLYQQVARIGKALSSPKRLELLDVLCQGEKTVDSLALQLEISLKLASAHLRVLRDARMVQARRDGKYIVYSLADSGVSDLWVNVRTHAEERLLELQMALGALAENAQELQHVDRKSILERARGGEIVVIDVRPENEFLSGHLPLARSMPLAELARRIKELPRDVPLVAYCRGPFCVMAVEAVALLRKRGYQAFHLSDGVAEWRARGLPVELHP